MNNILCKNILHSLQSAHLRVLLFVCLCVCLLTGLCKKYMTDFVTFSHMW